MHVCTQQCTHTITGLQGVVVLMLLWLLIGSHAKVEDLCGYTTHSHVLGSSTLSWSGTLVTAVTVNDYTISPYIDSTISCCQTKLYVGQVWDKCDAEINLH